MSSPPSIVLASEPDPVPADLRAVIDLFANQLAKVAFPDLDAASLRREADELRAEATHVERARIALARAIDAFDARLAKLTDSAARAVAYARIYGEAHPDRQPLVAALAALDKPATSAPAGKRRGRPPRSAELFDATTLPVAAGHHDPA